MRGACKKFATGDSLSPIDRGDGNVMAKLGDVCTIVSGTTPKTSVSEYWDGDINWITPAELNEDTVVINESKRKITKAGVNSCGLSPFPAGTVILSSRAPIGKTAMAGTEMYCNQGFKSLICSDKIHNKYLFWFLRSKTEMLNSLGRGATFKEISKSIVENIEIPLPDISEQRRIADTLDKVSEGIEVCRKMLGELDLMVKAKFGEMFGNIPETEFVTMGSVCSLITDGTHQPPKFVDSGIPFLFVSNITTNMLTYNAEKFISAETYAELMKRTPVEIGDILLSTVGSYGHPAIVKSNKQFSFQRHIAFLKPRHNIIDSTFLHSAILTAGVQRQIEAKVKGIAQKTLNLSEIRTLRFPLPPLQEQERYAALVKNINKSKLTIQEIRDKMETEKLALMQGYFK